MKDDFTTGALFAWALAAVAILVYQAVPERTPHVLTFTVRAVDEGGYPLSLKRLEAEILHVTPYKRIPATGEAQEVPVAKGCYLTRTINTWGNMPSPPSKIVCTPGQSLEK